MKIFTLPLLFFCFSISFAQDTYLPLVQDDAVWSIRTLRFRYVGQDPVTQYEIYVTDTLTEHYNIATFQDTLIDGESWHPVYASTDTVFSWNSTELRLDGFIREEGRRVYYQGRLNQGHNNPVYDFNLLPGDTVLTATTDVGEPITMVITKIDTVTFTDGVPRRRWHTGYWITPHSTGQDTLIHMETAWIEGLGDLRHGLLSHLPFLVMNPRFLDHLLCFERQGAIIYQSPVHQSCFVERIGMVDNYLPMLRPDAEWSVVHKVPYPIGNDRYDDNYYTEHYRLGKDSVIEGQLWKKLYYSRDSIFNWYDPDLQFGGLIREENKKVYYRGPLRSDGIMYDFNLLERDTFWRGTDDTGAPHSLFVYNIDTVYLMGNVPRRRYHLRYYDHVNDRVWNNDISVWIEGIGDQRHGLIEQRFRWGYNIRLADELICYKLTDELIYDSPNYEGCFFEQITVATQEPIESNLTVYPNPSRNLFYLSFSGQSSIDFLMVYNSQGQPVYSSHSPMKTTDNLQIDASSWAPGLYFLKFLVGKHSQVMKLVKL